MHHSEQHCRCVRVPVVATQAGGIPEVVVDGETGLLAPIRDAEALAAAVQRIITNPDLTTQYPGPY